MKMKKLVCMLLVLIFTVLVISVPGAAAEPAEDASVVPVTHYEYPITPDSPDWFNYTVLEKVEMLRIPDEILDRMTDEALIDAILAYPFLCDLHAYGFGTIDEGIETSRSYFSALDELLSRDTAATSLKTYGLASVESIASEITNEVSDEAFYAGALAEIITAVCDDTVVSIEYGKNPSAEPLVEVAVYTPKGTRVDCSKISETHPASDHLNWDNALQARYNITKLYDGTCVFNCHSYAWYSRSASNPYWMENPSAYMSDGSYRRIYSGSSGQLYMGTGIQSGDIVYYGGNTHSAVVTASPSASTAAIGNGAGRLCRNCRAICAVFGYRAAGNGLLRGRLQGMGREQRV